MRRLKKLWIIDVYGFKVSYILLEPTIHFFYSILFMGISKKVPF
ncbi:hypothetical protein CPM_1652 [Cuniculiplasma divulgatum]|uniref:Uncharacterized protein n=1 Tax=Cuniculiplasma divulgatum TaxID=1673428 RepID=A0A1R4A902_9ARCH|nr:hypothetical protein CPM_1652 [Cuniculiplasma divulgatum]